MSAIVEMTGLEPLSYEEERDRLLLERKVERPLIDQALALVQLRERRLYRSTHTSWDSYLQARFGMGRSNANYIIRSLKYIRNIVSYYTSELVTLGHQEGTASEGTEEIYEADAEVVTQGHQQLSLAQALESLPNDVILPTSEKQIRSMRNVPEEYHGQVWATGVEQNGGRPPTGAQVNEIVQQMERQLQERANTPNPFDVGQGCIIRACDHPELRGLGGAPAIVVEANDFSCRVRTGLGDRLVSRFNLEAMDLTAEEERGMHDRLGRLFRLNQVRDLDPLAQDMVQKLSRQSSSELSAFQLQALVFLERQYGLAEAEVDKPEDESKPQQSLAPPLAPLYEGDPPEWAIEEVPDGPPDPTEEAFFKPGDRVQVCETASHHANAEGAVTEVCMPFVTVKLDDVRKPAVFRSQELRKLALPKVEQPEKPQEEDSG